MNEKNLEKVNQQIYFKFPILMGIIPDIKQEEDKSLLIYKGQSVTANGHPISLIVRVVTDSTGKILKISSSR